MDICVATSLDATALFPGTNYNSTNIDSIAIKYVWNDTYMIAE